MILASARREVFTALALGNTSATSDAKTTTLLPCAKRRAYLPRTPREKSYSARIVAASFVLLTGFFKTHAMLGQIRFRFLRVRLETQGHGQMRLDEATDVNLIRQGVETAQRAALFFCRKPA
jgi:hypothetical protein